MNCYLCKDPIGLYYSDVTLDLPAIKIIHVCQDCVNVGTRFIVGAFEAGTDIKALHLKRRPSDT